MICELNFGLYSNWKTSKMKELYCYNKTDFGIGEWWYNNGPKSLVGKVSDCLMVAIFVKSKSTLSID